MWVIWLVCARRTPPFYCQIIKRNLFYSKVGCTDAVFAYRYFPYILLLSSYTNFLNRLILSLHTLIDLHTRIVFAYSYCLYIQILSCYTNIVGIYLHCLIVTLSLLTDILFIYWYGFLVLMLYFPWHFPAILGKLYFYSKNSNYSNHNF